MLCFYSFLEEGGCLDNNIIVEYNYVNLKDNNEKNFKGLYSCVFSTRCR